jgi:AcrR family transcriptional regulator
VTATADDIHQPARSAGRPRSAEADEAILAATLELVAERGLGVSIEAIAAAAGVGKTTIYRRWDNKDKLIVDAMASIQDPLPVISGKSVRDDLIVLVDYVRKHSEKTLSGKLIGSLAGEASAELMETYIKTVIEPRREQMRSVLRDGVARGELRADLDIELCLPLLVGPMLTLIKIWKCTPVDPSTAERIVDSVLYGIAPR